MLAAPAPVSIFTFPSSYDALIFFLKKDQRIFFSLA